MLAESIDYKLPEKRKNPNTSNQNSTRLHKDMIFSMIYYLWNAQILEKFVAKKPGWLLAKTV